jgi:transcriptional regulator with XRE-family HTH domain
MPAPKPVLERFGTALREHRSTRKLTQEGLAAQSGLHRTYIGDLERGRRNASLKVLERLAKALRVTISELLKGV